MDPIIINLPKPNYDSKTSIEQTLKNRRSHRGFSDAAFTLDHVSQLLWSAQGITDTVDMLRTGPSAGAFSGDQIMTLQKFKASKDPIYQFPIGRMKLNILSCFSRFVNIFRNSACI